MDEAKNVKVRSLYDTPNTKIPSENDMKDSTLTYGLNILLSCFEAQKLNKSIRKRLDPAEYALAHHKSSSQAARPEIQCLSANLYFFRCIEKQKKVFKARCESEPIILGRRSSLEEAYHHKSFLHERELEGDDEKWTDQVPKIFDGFKISDDQNLSRSLSNVLKAWSSYALYIVEHQENMNASIAFLTLRCMIICGEYLHLHKLTNDELRLWNMACQVAQAQGQMKACIYINSHYLKLKVFDNGWVTSSKTLIENNKAFEDTEVAAMFRLELANFYFDCGKIEEAKCLLEKVKTMRCYNYPKQTNDPTVFGYTADIEFRNYFNGKADQEEYVYRMVQMHYALRDFHDSIDDKQKYDEIEYKLLGCSKMFDILCDIVMPTVSLHPYFEIYSHVNDWFLAAQKLGATLRIADCLKYLCYIDLLLHRIDFCEQKVNELEKLLCLSQFQEWPLAKKSNRKYVYKRPSYEKKKPDFVKKLFRIPDCSTPKGSPCNCFVCTNLDYYYTVFACTYIRAQVYCFVDYEAESEQYFFAGSGLQQTLNGWDTDESRKDGDFTWKKNRNYMVDYLMYMVDFGLFIAKFTPEKTDDAILLFEKAIEVAAENNLTNHQVAVFATEMKFEHLVSSLDEDKLFSAIYVPHPKKLDGKESVEEKKGPMTRSQSAKLALEKSAKLALEKRAKLALEKKAHEGPMTRAKAAELLKAQASTSKK